MKQKAKKGKFCYIEVYDANPKVFDEIDYDFKNQKWKCVLDYSDEDYSKIYYKRGSINSKRYDTLKIIKSLKAAKRYVKKHYNELKDYKVTYVVCSSNDSIFYYKLKDISKEALQLLLYDEIRSHTIIQFPIDDCKNNINRKN